MTQFATGKYWHRAFKCLERVNLNTGVEKSLFCSSNVFSLIKIFDFKLKTSWEKFRGSLRIFWWLWCSCWQLKFISVVSLNTFFQGFCKRLLNTPPHGRVARQGSAHTRSPFGGCWGLFWQLSWRCVVSHVVREWGRETLFIAEMLI